MMREKLGINDFILKCWDIDSEGWTFVILSDQWWEVRAVSESLGEFRAVSHGPMDVEETLVGLLDQIKEAARQKGIEC